MLDGTVVGVDRGGKEASLAGGNGTWAVVKLYSTGRDGTVGGRGKFVATLCFFERQPLPCSMQCFLHFRLEQSSAMRVWPQP